MAWMDADEEEVIKEEVITKGDIARIVTRIIHENY